MDKVYIIFQDRGENEVHIIIDIFSQKERAQEELKRLSNKHIYDTFFIVEKEVK